MKNRITRKRCVILLAAVVLTIIGFWLGSSRLRPASAADGSVAFLHDSIIGMVPGQTVRVCLGTTDPRGPVVDWSVKLSDEEGSRLFQLPEQRSPAGEWRCGNIPRNSLAAGEPETERIQVAVQVLAIAPAGTKPPEIIGSLEIVTATGQTLTYWQIQMENTLISPVQAG
jgi:hypothetical protein